MSTSYFIHPQSPLVFRSGRPFGAIDGQGGGAGYDFPPPSALAGALRAAWVDASGHTMTAQDQTLLRLHVTGGLRVRRDADLTVYAPCPADAVYGPPGGMSRIPMLWRAAPRLSGAQQHAACGTNLPHGLVPVRCGLKDKPVFGPAELSLESLAQWMGSSQQREAPRGKDAAAALPHDLRTHVVIDAQRLTHVEGGLFESDGLDFDDSAAEHGLIAWLHAHATPANVPAPDPEVLDKRSFRLGADGRAALLERLPQQQAMQPTCPGPLAAALDKLGEGACFRLALLTSACFLRNGWYPDGLRPLDRLNPDSPVEGCLVGLAPKREPAQDTWRLRLRAAAFGRWLPLAGSSTRDDTGKNQFMRSPLRRLVPAGAVYWFEIVHKGSVPLSGLWMKSACRTEYARDGFGLAVPGLHFEPPASHGGA